MREEDIGKYKDRPVLKIFHSKLARAGESPFRSECPFCGEGLFLVQRDMETFELRASDFCVLCAQRVEYADIDQVGLA